MGRAELNRSTDIKKDKYKLEVQGNTNQVSIKKNTNKTSHQLDLENLTATVQPGLNTKRFIEHVERYGLFYPPDPSSSAVSTIGGGNSSNVPSPRLW